MRNVSKVDELGRVIIPKQMRKSLNIQAGAPIEVIYDGESIMLRKYEPDPNSSQDQLASGDRDDTEDM